MKEKNNFSVDFRIWFYAGEEKLLGKGRVELLERIKETGSIAQAAKEMNMSYRQAWQMVKEMNERAPNPLVEKQLGGKNGGGAIITKEGEKWIKLFYTVQKKINSYIKQEVKKINW